MFVIKRLLSFILCFLVLACFKNEINTRTTGYDPMKDPFNDLETAISKTTHSGQRIILEVGGEWCIWCHRLEEFINQNGELKEALHKNYVVVKVNYSEENKNEKFLSQYPKIDGYPHIFVLDADGSLLHSQNTGELEAGKGYDFDKVMTFIAMWKPVS